MDKCLFDKEKPCLYCVKINGIKEYGCGYCNYYEKIRVAKKNITIKKVDTFK